VVAIVMDIFTDVDLLFEVLDAAARRVPVYILLDEMNSQLFLDTAAKCRVNLNYVEFLRVRTVSGPTYYCRTGMSFKGHVKEKFLLVDCMVVLSGNYSLTWEGRCHSAECPCPSCTEPQNGGRGGDPVQPWLQRGPRASGPRPGPDGFQISPRTETPQPLGTLFQCSVPCTLNKGFLLFKQNLLCFSWCPLLLGSAMRMYKKVEMENSQMDPVRGFLRSKQLELDAFKRHSFAEGTFENFASSKQYARQMFMNNMDEFKIQSSHFQKDQFYQYQFEHPHLSGRPQGLFERLRGARPGFNELEDYGEGPRYPELESGFSQEGFPLRLDYVPSNSSREVRHGSDQLNPAGNGPMGMMLKRQNIGQKFICQTSPTQKQSLEQRLFLQDKDEDQDEDKNAQENRTGLRNWRISSYLSAYQSEPEEGLPMPMESEAYNDVLGDPLTKHPTDLIPAFKSPMSFNSKSLGIESAKEFAEPDRIGEESPLMKQDAFRSRINPLIQRSSRLRSSLIFSAAKLDQPNTTIEKVQMIQKEQMSSELTKDNETIKTAASSKVAELLEKYKAVGKDTERASNLRDDTKVILEQISANSQKNRAELAKQLPSTSNPDLSKSTASLERKGEKERSCNIHRSESFGSQKRNLQRQPSEDRDTLLKKMENMRKEKRVYSRFEVFCKKDEHLSQSEEEYDTDAKDKKMGKFMPKILGTFKTKK
ncbi:FA83H protein, partial [Columbina picui]|nr:FA83H protein [Columbina picui]